MTIPNVSATPTIWSDAALAEDAQKALEEFVDRRLAEPGGKYLAHVKMRRSAVVRLFKLLADIDPITPDPKIVRAILLDEALFDALRYVAGPPVSEDDLGVLVTKDVKGFNKASLKNDDALSIAVMKLICKLSDPFRFPWIAAKRDATRSELRTAIAATATMHASQALQTERRGHGKVVEKRLELRLEELGLSKYPDRPPRRAGKQPLKALRPSLPKVVWPNPAITPATPTFTVNASSMAARWTCLLR